MAPSTRLNLLLAAVFMAAGAEAWAENSCLQQSPLLDAHREGLILPPNDPGVIGSWPLAISSDQPEVITAAQLHLSVEPSGGVDSKDWNLKVHLTFEDPEGWGLPFNFDFVILNWQDELGEHEASLDWSASCQNVGVTLFPGGTYSDLAPILGSPSQLKNVRVRLWGRR